MSDAVTNPRDAVDAYVRLDTTRIKESADHGSHHQSGHIIGVIEVGR